MNNLSTADLYRTAYNNDAPDVLLKKISELQNTLDQAKQNPSKNLKAITFYESIVGAMKYAWSQMIEQDQVYKQNQFLKRENDFLKEQAAYLNNELNKYKTVEQLTVSGELNETIAAVNEFLKNKLPNE
ncbi:hypothetical protein [Pedobacter miscanthi]|jgi:hypothetical protein|uniref:hypothetical protein n=1 Tax=Pedobacter miscanthi TaxID=2259170 RepID=UPI00292DF620|nr:hypothetical protein [Pedobacter miscanthi]